MLRSLFLAATCMAFMASGADRPLRKPVLVELFTSEGCSSCPPADRQLQLLDPQVVVLSEHVDYWDQLGWKDKFSSPEMTHRQEGYVKTFGIEGPYTPQMVVDGAAQFTGGDGRQAAAEIEKAASRPKATVVLARTASGVKVEIEAVPHEADIWVAVADNSDQTRVGAGENRGHTLSHVSVVRSLHKIGYVKRGGTFSRQIDLPSFGDGQRVVVFLQESGQGRVWGAAVLPSAGI
ncbi:MAG TPA: DUF1223 domain-containing protein [Bryobacteraceae bacterium]|jgi:hypothetical protein|nr:DUF1223 domain-containing protein [Bryobacteraceae bacterium]